MLRHRRDDADRLAILVERHGDFTRMEMQRRATRSWRVAVDRVAQDRPAHLRAVDPQLMRASSQRFEARARCGQWICLVTRHLVTAGWPCGSCFCHQPNIGVEAAERHVDFALLGVGTAFDDGPVGLVDRAVAEQLAELRQRLAVAAEDEASGRVAVEPVRKSRRPRQAEAQRVEMILIDSRFRSLLFGEPRCTAMPAGLSITSISPSR